MRSVAFCKRLDRIRVRGRSCAGMAVLLDVAEVYIKIDRGKSYGIDLYRRR